MVTKQADILNLLREKQTHFPRSDLDQYKSSQSPTSPVQ